MFQSLLSPLNAEFAGLVLLMLLALAGIFAGIALPVLNSPQAVRRKRMLSAVLLASVLASGCAQIASSGLKMTVETQDFGGKQAKPPLQGNVLIAQVSGGEETNPLWTSEIGDQEFMQALEQSLIAAGFYSQDGRFRLSAMILEVDQPLLGIDMTVTTRIHYSLVDLESQEVLFSDTVESSFTATMSDAFAGFERLKIANEGSAKGNIAELIRRLLALSVDEVSLAD